ncbi:MAG: flavin reductase [Spirochaetales bacterium]|nr:flavin reductase [Spirochaetales bacterium]
MRKKIGTYDAMRETLDRLGKEGLLLATGKQANPMTIGWGTIGRIWGRRVFIVLVRPTRYSFSLLEALPEFSVNVPTDDLRKTVAFCGSKSGRDVDKISEYNLGLIPGESISVPTIQECSIQYECKVIHKSNVINGDLDPAIVAGSYAGGDFHRVYYGEILNVYQAE